MSRPPRARRTLAGLLLVLVGQVPVAAAAAAVPADRAAAAAQLYDGWFGEVIHQEFVEDAIDRVRTDLRTEVVNGLGAERAQQCRGLDRAITRAVRAGAAPALETGFKAPQTRQAVVDALAGAFNLAELKTYRVQVRQRAMRERVRQRIDQDREFGERLAAALHSSPLNVAADADARARLERAAERHIAPVVRRCAQPASP